MIENIARAGQVSTKLGDAIARTSGAYTAAELEDGLAAARRGDELTDDETAAALIALAIETGRPLVVSDPAEMSDLEELDALADTALSNWEMAAATRDAARAELALAQMRVQRAEDAIFKATAEYDRACQRRDEARRADEGDPQMRAAADVVACAVCGKGNKPADRRPYAGSSLATCCTGETECGRRARQQGR